MRPLIQSHRLAWATEPVDAEEYFAAFFQAALSARRHVLLAGWELDSRTPLLRGEAARDAPTTIELGELLGWLCERREDLWVYLLSWDWTWLFAADREWFQRRR